MQSQLNRFQDIKKQNITDFAKSLDKFSEYIHTIAEKDNLTIFSDKGQLKVGMKCELKIEYQTDKQLSSKPR